jgi:hypothetical protein
MSVRGTTQATFVAAVVMLVPADVVLLHHGVTATAVAGAAAAAAVIAIAWMLLGRYLGSDQTGSSGRPRDRPARRFVAYLAFASCVEGALIVGIDGLAVDASDVGLLLLVATFTAWMMELRAQAIERRALVPSSSRRRFR